MTKLPSVSRILKPFSDFSAIRPEVLENAADQGEIVHSLLARHILGLEIFPDEITAEVEGYFNSGRRWCDRHLLKALLVEEVLKDFTQGYLGHPDLIGVLKGDPDPSLWDWKRAVYQLTHAVQIGGYYGLGRKAGYAIRRCGPIYLRKDGKMPNVSKSETTGTVNQDYAVFLAALMCWRRFGGK